MLSKSSTAMVATRDNTTTPAEYFVDADAIIGLLLLVEYQLIVIADKRKMPRVPTAFERGGRGRRRGMTATIAVS